jgi:hypothetical protein
MSPTTVILTRDGGAPLVDFCGRNVLQNNEFVKVKPQQDGRPGKI